MDTSGNCFETFEADLEFGKHGEALVCAACVRNIVRRLLQRSRRSPVRGEDFIFLGQKVEVKTDRQMADSGNFAFEESIDGTPGLLAYDDAEAPDLVAYVEVLDPTTAIEERAFGISRARIWWMKWPSLIEWFAMREHIERRRGRWRQVSPKGDKRGVVFLVPRSDVRDSGIILDIWNLERS